VTTLLKQELLGALRTYRLVIMIFVLLVVGLISPLLARYTPLILENVPDLPPGISELVPEPSVQEAVTQYIKNMSQFGVLLVIVINMGLIAGEKERGTLVMLLTRPVRPTSIVLAKWVAGMVSLLAGVLCAGAGCALYTVLLFGEFDLAAFVALNALMLLFLAVYLTLSLLSSALAPTQVLAAAGAFGMLVVLLILGSLPRVGEFMPGELLSWGGRIFTPPAESAWAALLISVSLIVLALVSACFALERQEL